MFNEKGSCLAAFFIILLKLFLLFISLFQFFQIVFLN